jgi:acyl-CoA synthetase (AMP-forming)/AMP-acid ligase II
LNHAAATFISKHVYLLDQWGITESGKIVDLFPDPEDFEYCAFEIEANGLEMRHVSGESYEMILHRTPTSVKYILYFNREPDENEFRPGDLWTPHPDPKKSKHLWKFVGRVDDLINYQDGNNFHPTAYELKHSEHDMISLAAMTGTNHRQPVLLLELYDPSLADTPEKRTQMIEKLWNESVVPVNEVAPKNGQVAETHILIASPDKPFDRTPKGSIARKATLRKYEKETEEIYRVYGDRTMDVRQRFENQQNVHDHQ